MIRILIVSIFLVVTGCSTYQPKEVNNVCTIFYGETDWFKDARKAEKRWGTPIHVTMAIMKQESTFRAKVRPKRPTFLFIYHYRENPLPMAMLRHRIQHGMTIAKIPVTGVMIAMILVMRLTLSAGIPIQVINVGDFKVGYLQAVFGLSRGMGWLFARQLQQKTQVN